MGGAGGLEALSILERAIKVSYENIKKTFYGILSMLTIKTGWHQGIIPLLQTKKILKK